MIMIEDVQGSYEAVAFCRFLSRGYPTFVFTYVFLLHVNHRFLNQISVLIVK